MSSNIATELKPCPFCGNSNLRVEERDTRGFVTCLYCGGQAQAAVPKNGSLTAEVSERWNMRKVPSVSVETKTEDSALPEPSSAMAYVRQNAVGFGARCGAVLRATCGHGWIGHEDVAKIIDGQLANLLSPQDGGEPAAEASSQNPTALTEPASGKFKMSIFEELLDAAQDAATHLKRASIGSGMHELGIRLQLAIERAAK